MIRVAVIGAGWYAAQSHIPALRRRDDVVLDGVCRLGAEALERVRAHFGFAFASEDYRDVLARRPDAVVVASPHHLHFEHAAAALGAGAHVLVEKPMTLRADDAWALVAAARQAGRHLLVANGYNYLPHLPQIRAALQAGAIGRIEHVACSFVSVTRNVFMGEAGLSSWSRAFFAPDRATWQNPAQGGGFAYGQATHAVALLLWLTGLQPVAVSAHVQGGAVDICDAAAVQFAGGAVGAITGAAAMPEGHRALLRLIITGSDGVLTLEMDRDEAVIHAANGARQSFPVQPGEFIYHCVGPIDALCDLAQGARGGGGNRSPGPMGAATIGLLEAMLHSARQGGASVSIAAAPEAEPA